MALTAAANNSPSLSAASLPRHNEPATEPSESNRASTHVHSGELATSVEAQQREVDTLSTHLLAACGEIPRALGVAGFSLVFGYAGQKAVLSLMQSHNAKRVLVIGGGVGDASSGVAKEFAKAFLANCFPTVKVPNNVPANRLWPLTKQAGTALLLSGFAEGLFHFLAGLSNSFGISKEMSYYGVDRIADKSEAYLKILKHINPNEIWSPLGVKVGSEFIKDMVIVLGVACAFKLAHAEHDFQMCRKFNMRKIMSTALLNSAGRVVVSVCSAAWVNSNQNSSQTAFMFTGARNASLPALFNFLRVVSMGIMLAAFTRKSATRDAPIDPENRAGVTDDISLLSSPTERVTEEHPAAGHGGESTAAEPPRVEDPVNSLGDDHRDAAADGINAAEGSQAKDATQDVAERTSIDPSPDKPGMASSMTELPSGETVEADPATASTAAPRAEP